MGRGKLNLEFIANEKARSLTFNQRKKGLLKKIHEFVTLCDVAACLIIYGPKQDSGSSSEPEIWPQDPNQVRRVLDVFRSKKKEPNYGQNNYNYGVSKYLEDRKKKIECDLARQRKKNLEAKYPTRPELIDFMTESQLRGFAASLETKADFVRSRIDFLRLRGSNMMVFGNGDYDSSFPQFGNSNLEDDDQLDLSFLDVSWDEIPRYCKGAGDTSFDYLGDFDYLGWDETKLPAEQMMISQYSCGAPILGPQFLNNMEGIGG